MTTIAALLAIALCLLLAGLCARGLYRLFKAPDERISDGWKPPPRRDE